MSPWGEERGPGDKASGKAADKIAPREMSMSKRTAKISLDEGSLL